MQPLLAGCVLRHYSYSKLYGKEPGYKEQPRLYIEYILPVPWPFDISRVLCTRFLVAQN